MHDLLRKLKEEKRMIEEERNSRNKLCEFCGKDLSEESIILVQDKKVCCKEHKKPGEDGWKLDIIA